MGRLGARREKEKEDGGGGLECEEITLKRGSISRPVANPRL